MATIFIDAGHGGSDPGAKSDSFIEKDLNLKVAFAARDFLSDYNCKVIMSRESDIRTNINNSTARAAEVKADVYLCIHHNAAGGDGAEVYYWHDDKKAKALAEELIERFKDIGQNSRGVKPSTTKAYNFGACRINSKNGIPAVLGEFAFVDNLKDREIIDTDEELKKEGEAYALAVINFLGLKKKSSQKPPTPEKPVTPSNPATKELKFKVGDTVQFGGGYHYKSASSDIGSHAPASMAKVTHTASNGKHPYHCRAVAENGNFKSGVYGWVDEVSISSIKPSTQLKPIIVPPTPPPAQQKIDKKDIVRLKKDARTYTGGRLLPFVYNRNYTVRQIDGDRVVIAFGIVVIAAVKMSDLILIKKVS